MKIKVIMMFKNEDDLLLPWVRYHANLVGEENLIIYDNGSSSPKTLAMIKRISEEGRIKINRNKTSSSDFVAKGEIFCQLIGEFDKSDEPADFYIPLDCDEFIGVCSGDNVRLSREALNSELSGFLNNRSPLRILAGLDNNPFEKGQFKWSRGQKKTFFAKKSCKYLDHGFHAGKTIYDADDIITNLIYVHFHFKPFHIHMLHAKEKLKPFTNDFSDKALSTYIDEKRPGFHCARELLSGVSGYRARFKEPGYESFPQVEAAFREIGISMPFV